jgi:predicted dinucleotide-binding enzyme
MHIGILGTSMVGQTSGGKFVGLGHDVVVGTRDVAATLARTDPHPMRLPAFGVWLQQHPSVRIGTFADAAGHGEIVINATNGAGALDALTQAGASHLHGKVLMDLANSLDSSQGMPPTLTVCNSGSLGEQIQRAFPRVKVVKTLNTVTASLMVHPHQLADGEHHFFIRASDARRQSSRRRFTQRMVWLEAHY